MGARLKITEPTGRSWEIELAHGRRYTIGRSKDSDIVLNDRRASRRHAFIADDLSGFRIIDGHRDDAGELQLSVNHVFVNGEQTLERLLVRGDVVVIGESRLEYIESPASVAPAVLPPSALLSHPTVRQNAATKRPLAAEADVRFDDRPLGGEQVEISANEIIGRQSHFAIPAPVTASPDEVRTLRRKAKMLELLYEMSKTLGTVFDLKEIFEKATDLIFRGTPADRVVALLADETGGDMFDGDLHTVALRTREADSHTDNLTVSRTVTQKVMREKVALLSQDARADAEFRGAESIVAQGVRSTICAPLVTESSVHGVVYADRLDPFATFTADDLELISAVAAQAAVTVEMAKAHERLAREEVARANYSRFMPEYVVGELLENPESFKLGGTNQTVTVLFADIRSFTSLSERENPERVVGLLNRFFSVMTEIVFEFGGTLDKYTGDGLMAIFGAPTATPDDALNAVKAAVTMQKRMDALNTQLAAEGFAPISIGVGLHTGEAVVGYVGTERRSEFTAVGDTVNLASRLESNAAGGEVLVSEATLEACSGRVPASPREPLAVRNREQPVSVFQVRWA